MFETLSSTISGPRGAHRRLAALPAAIALHAVALGGLGLAQLWAVEELPAPVEAMSPVLIVALAPPPPPPPPPRTAGGARPERPTTGPLQPVAVPEDTPADAAAEGPTDAEGVDGGVEGGERNGKPGGTVGGQPDSDGPTVQPAAEIYRVGGKVTPPVLVHRVVPEYPEAARRARLQGVVVIDAVIDSDGAVVEATVLNDAARFGGLAEAALRAVREWRYEPARLEGRPVAVRMTVTVTFSLV
jgi:protein TonB